MAVIECSDNCSHAWHSVLTSEPQSITAEDLRRLLEEARKGGRKPSRPIVLGPHHVRALRGE